MTSVSVRLLEEAASLPEGTAPSAKRFLHLGQRAAVDQALTRLARRGQLIRVSRGLHLRPVKTRFGLSAPGVEVSLKALEQETGEIIASSGATAANRLGLTTHVSVRLVYLTSERSRCLMLGAQVIELQHAPRWQLVLLAGRGVMSFVPLHGSAADKGGRFCRTWHERSSRTSFKSCRPHGGVCRPGSLKR